MQPLLQQANMSYMIILYWLRLYIPELAFGCCSLA